MRVFENSNLLFNTPMDNKERRRQHLLAAIARTGTIEDLAALTDSNPKHISQLKNGTRGIGDKFARKMEEKLGLSRGAWDQPLMDADHNVSDGPPLNRSVPLISFVTAGELCTAEDPYAPGDADRWIETYIPVTKGMYALRVEGDSMSNPGVIVKSGVQGESGGGLV